MTLYLTKHPTIEELGYYIKKDDKIDGENFCLKGFKDNIPVLESSNAQLNPGHIKITKNLPTSLTKFQFDESGEKYIHLNGQKLKVVPQGKIPEEVRKRTMLLKHQMINIGSLKNPLKVRVISSATQINSAESFQLVKPQIPDKLPLITKDKNTSIQGVKKFKVISTKVLKPTSTDADIHINTSSHSAAPVNPKVVYQNSAQYNREYNTVGDDNIYLVPLKNVNTPREKLLTKKNLEVLNKVKMQALNLSKKKIESKTPEKLKPLSVAEIAVQTVITEPFKLKLFSDKEVQTDIQRNCQENFTDLLDFELPNLFDWDSPDSPVLNNVNIGYGPSIGKLISTTPNKGSSLLTLGAPGKNMGLSIGGKSFLNDDKMKKQLLFFSDLRECLVPNINGNLPIHEGVLKNDVALVKRMCIALKARKAGVNLENNNGCNPLQLAVINDAHVDIVQTLLDSGADVTEVDGEGNNILHLGAKFTRYKVLEVILYHPVMRQNRGENHHNCINSFNFEGLTPLMICCMSSWKEGAVLFIQHGANVNLKDQTSGRTALFHAAEALNDDIVRLLLEHKADPKIKNFFGTSPHDAMYELEDMPDKIKNLIFGKTKKRSIEAEMNPVKTAKAAKTLKTFSKLQRIDHRDGVIITPPYKMAREVK